MTLEAYEEMKPTHAWHRAIIKNVLCDSKKLRGLTLEEIGVKVENHIANYRRLHHLPKSGRDRPTIGNRMRELKKEVPCLVVCLKGVDGLNHHWHTERWKEVSKNKIHTFFPSLWSGVLQQGEVKPGVSKP